MSEAFLCPTCGFEGVGRYCSQCGGEMWVSPGQVLTIARKRLELNGFVDLKDDVGSKFPADLIECLSPLNQSLQTVMLTDQVVMSNRTLQIVGLTRRADLNDAVLDTLDRFYESFAKGLKNLSGGRVTSADIAIVVFFDRKPPSDDLERFKKAARAKARFGGAVGLRFGPVDIDGKTVGFSRLDPIRGPLMQALRQVGSGDGVNAGADSASSNIGGEALRVGFEPIIRFLSGLKTLFQPSSLARQIELNRLKARDLVSYLVTVSVLSALIGALGGLETGLVGVPLVDEVLDVGLHIGFGLACAVPVHYLLQMWGGESRLPHCFLATTFVNATGAPFITLFEVFAPGEPSTPISIFILFYWASVLSILYKTKYTRTTIACFLGTIPVGVGVGVVVAFVVGVG